VKSREEKSRVFYILWSAGEVSLFGKRKIHDSDTPLISCWSDYFPREGSACFRLKRSKKAMSCPCIRTFYLKGVMRQNILQKWAWIEITLRSNRTRKENTGPCLGLSTSDSIIMYCTNKALLIDSGKYLNRDKYTFSLLWRCVPTRAMAYTFLMFLDHTKRRTTIGKTSLNEWSAHRRDLYMTTHNIHNRQISMPRWHSNPQFQQMSCCNPAR